MFSAEILLIVQPGKRCMLIESLGYRPPARSELNAVSFWKTIDKKVYPTEVREYVRQVAHLYSEPLISYTGSGHFAPLGFAMDIGSKLQDRECWFLVTPTWSLLSPGQIRRIRRAAIWHRSRFPRHKFIFLCNTKQEFDLVLRAGEAAELHTKTASVSESIFRPLPDTEVKFDAIYNAQMRKWKRHALSMEIETCAHIYYRASPEQEKIDEEKKIIELIQNNCPGHKVLNKLTIDNKPIRYQPEQVNELLNTASVGLCLSKVEGPMLASVEYMLAGLPVVSTPSEGGRDGFFDDEYCIIADANPRSVANAVAALKAKNISREYIHAKTLKKVEAHRRRFLSLFNKILEESGAHERISTSWPFTKTPTASWKPVSIALEDALAYRVHDFGQVGSFHKIG